MKTLITVVLSTMAFGLNLGATLTVDSDVNVLGSLTTESFLGIGTSPDYPFVLKFSGDGLPSDALALESWNTSDRWYFSMSDAATELQLHRNDQMLMRILKDGFVGFGSMGKSETWIPHPDGSVYLTSNKDVAGKGHFYLQSLETDGSHKTRFFVDGITGNVGIGIDGVTKRPIHRLEVDGNLKVNGSVIMSPRGDLKMFSGN